MSCSGKHSERSAVIIGEHDVVAKEQLYRMVDENGTDCPTLDEVKALAKKVFPEAEMTMEYITGTTAYMNYAAAH